MLTTVCSIETSRAITVPFTGEVMTVLFRLTVILRYRCSGCLRRGLRGIRARAFGLRLRLRLCVGCLRLRHRGRVLRDRRLIRLHGFLCDVALLEQRLVARELLLRERKRGLRLGNRGLRGRCAGRLGRRIRAGFGCLRLRLREIGVGLVELRLNRVGSIARALRPWLLSNCSRR